MDVVVVGGGPIGLYIAGELASKGYDVSVIEEHSEIGNPSHCSGLFSTKIFDIVGNIGILHPARKATIYAPNGKSVKIGDEKIRGYVVDRVDFDRSMARMASRKGAEIILKERVRKVDYPKVLTNKGEYRGKLIIGADGINSVVRRSIRARLPMVIGAVQVLAHYEYDEEDNVDIFLGNSVAPGFFAWRIPLFDGMAKIGLASYRSAWEYLKGMMKKMNIRALSISGGGIPLGMADKTYSKGIMIVGDAAGQVKATSGGGVYPGLMCARCAIDTATRALEKGDFSERVLSSYERCWRDSIGKELSHALYLHKIYRKIRDGEFNKLVEDLGDEKVLKVINQYGDIDYPSRVVWKVLRKKPSMMRYISIPARPYRKQI